MSFSFDLCMRHFDLVRSRELLLPLIKSQSVNVSFSRQPFIYPSLSRKCSGISRIRFNFRIPSFHIEITCRFSISDDMF
ncbi:hypothetical protein CKAN_01509100 [Cinnamomum micranthum f. kanehirae]|uniref:Uncharacterized protein n=1 Tax=Cinnamomum micranthum f. kanehirae TaxID=337451 RepID=A0A443P616_9MAGN|nr:hypothetical protein CKAN_01509100 [Cinnamomum micranthum f. kanehirae]